MTTTADSGARTIELATEETNTAMHRKVAIDADLITVFFRRLEDHKIPKEIIQALAVAYLGRMHCYGGDELIYDDEITQAGNDLVERLEYWLQSDGGSCEYDGTNCWAECGGIIDASDIAHPAHCPVCGDKCACSRCCDLEAICRWVEVSGGVE